MDLLLGFAKILSNMVLTLPKKAVFIFCILLLLIVIKHYVSIS